MNIQESIDYVLAPPIAHMNKTIRPTLKINRYGSNNISVLSLLAVFYCIITEHYAWLVPSLPSSIAFGVLWCLVCKLEYLIETGQTDKFINKD